MVRNKNKAMVIRIKLRLEEVSYSQKNMKLRLEERSYDEKSEATVRRMKIRLGKV